jgi:hypothetical protein
MNSGYLKGTFAFSPALFSFHWIAMNMSSSGISSNRAERQFQAVEPENRMVARESERRWNDKLTELERVRQQAQAARGRRLR